MQFLPSTFAAYGEGGDILSPHDSIMAAGRYLAANGFADDRDNALYRYNNSDQYVQAVNDYAAVLAADPAAFAGYYRWDVYYNTTAGDVLLPIGYSATSPIPVADYLATHAIASPAVRISSQSEQILQTLLTVRIMRHARACPSDPKQCHGSSWEYLMAQTLLLVPRLSPSSSSLSCRRSTVSPMPTTSKR